jgi:asparagine synthase (glutamine-hydrolysing)
MCGIVGFAGRDVIDPERLVTMRDTMTHRGPDDLGVWISPDRMVGLAQRRLAIIDTSAGGHQPMADRSGRIHVVFNGEIYNFMDVRKRLEDLGHTFTSSSDTEVLIAAYQQWGEDFLEHLLGMFTIALFDAASRRLILARDRAGEKPLFLWQTPSRMAFASELKALFVHPDLRRKLNVNALDHYLAFGYVPRDLCIIQGIRKLLPACALSYHVDTGDVREWRYWDLPSADPSAAGRSPDDLADELHVLLREAVRRQLVADVPIGILLSGGVDSSLITAMAASVSSKPVKTFTISFPGHNKFDEAPYARLVARHFGTEHVEMPAQEATLELLPALVKQYDEPLADSSAIPTHIVSKLIRQHATVALGGDGGDELFGGYPQYVFVNRIAWLQSVAPAFLRRGIAAMAAARPAGMKGRNYLIAIGMDGKETLTRPSLYFDREWRTALLAASVEGAEPTPEQLRIDMTAGAQTMLQGMQRIDFRTYMVDDILVKVDRASMLASLETRAPFLDPAVIEFAFSKVPDRLKASLNQRKILLRRLAQRLLPRELDLRRKQGFSIPFQSWFEGQWGPMMRDVLSQADPAIFRQKAIADLFERQERTRNQIHRIYTLVFFELWRREYQIEL